MKMARVIERILFERKMSVRKLAKKCNLPPSTIYTMLKRGVRPASVNTVIAICQALEVTIEEVAQMAEEDSCKCSRSFDDLQDIMRECKHNLSAEEKIVLINALIEKD